MDNNTYALNLYVAGASLVTFFDYSGVDTLTVEEVYDQTVTIDLSRMADASGTTWASGGVYFDAQNQRHELMIFGVIENATGSRGQDLILGNELANVLAGEASLEGPGAADTLHGRAGNDTLLGGVGADLLTGDEGDDVLAAHVGADTLLGGSGVDRLEGGAGADLIDGGGDAGDMVVYAASGAGVKITLHPGGMANVQGGDAEGDILLGVTAVTGSEFRDILTDAAKTDLAQGANANLFLGGGGRDRMAMGGGNDTGLGGVGDDQIKGESGDDDLQGGVGDDKLMPGIGMDVMTGGSGADRFIFLKPGDSASLPASCDRITDFSASQGDRINLAAIDADLTRTGNQDFHLITGAFTGQAGEVALQADGADLLLLADCTGDGQADFALRLLGLTTLEVTSLIL